MEKKFRITDGKGFHVTFANGYTVSVQFGDVHYIEGRKLCTDEHGAYNETAEVAAWDPSGKWVMLGDCDQVVGWQSPEEVLEIMNEVSKM